MSYQVIARRYRPQSFKDIIGQEHISETLSHAIAKKRVGHAYLFCGPRGVGKTSTARILAKALNCVKGPTAEPCNECEVCKSITDGSSIDVIEIDAATNRGIDDARQLREYIQLAPSGQSRYRIYIIDEVHMMTKEAFNALLKTLEEPPSHAIFILATTEKNKVPITIISRCQQYDFKNITINDLIQQLNFILDNEKDLIVNENDRSQIMGILAKAGRGSMRDTESLLEQLIAFSGGELTLEKTLALLGTLPSELIRQWVDAIIEEDNAHALNKMSALIEQGIEFEHLCNELLDYLRSLALIKVLGTKDTGLDLTEDEIECRNKQAFAFKTEQLVQMMKLCTHGIEQLRRTVPGKVVMDLLTLDAIQVKQTMPLPEILEQLKTLQKSLGPEARTAPVQTPVRHAAPAAPSAHTPAAPAPKPAPAPVTKPAPEPPVIKDESQASNIPQMKEDYSSTATAVLEEPPSGNIQESWNQVLAEMQKQQPTLGVALTDLLPLRIEENHLMLGVAGNNSLIKMLLRKDENRRLIESQIQIFFGQRLQVKLEKTDKIPEPKQKPRRTPSDSAVELQEVKQDPLIRKAIDLFGAANIDIRKVPHINGDLENQEEDK
jgi:DNA polymerase-3 subunit gamma/tau